MTTILENETMTKLNEIQCTLVNDTIYYTAPIVNQGCLFGCSLNCGGDCSGSCEGNCAGSCYGHAR